ncbi:putative uncharacterized protein [Rhodococcus sp. AW25M09]|uniref:hypothetical protein n=1 Tax=Rhodococcus sp. AW25M09 TaxID=1268303 RepID=UPI0002AC59C0|nr:hypothetical protein [Rhodococcus sp. AW25M09]CCQ16244.1 putative uncharacterized protein [Rhodococcus sp. AW25M09]
MSDREFSLGRLAYRSLGAAVAVLALATALIGILQPSAGVALVIALVGVVGAITAMGVVSTRITNKEIG